VANVTVVALPDGRYRMYGEGAAPAGSPGGQRAIYSYISEDAVNFTPEPGVRFIHNGVHHPDVVRMKDGSFRMYYEDQSDPTRLRTTFRSAWSADGLSFTEDPGTRLTLLNSGMETVGILEVHVVLTPAGIFRMYYMSGPGTAYMLSATSADGLEWTREPGARMSGQELCPLDPSVGAFDPLYDLGGRLRMYGAATLCTASASSSGGWRRGVWEAISTDGVNFSTTSFPAAAAVGGWWIPVDTGNPTRGFVPQDADAILTPNGIRVLFGLYENPALAVPAPENGIYVMLGSS
jgi:hypothetical protein